MSKNTDNFNKLRFIQTDGDITASNVDSETATSGQLLSADGAGRAEWITSSATVDRYTLITDGSVTASASNSDTIKFRAGSNKVSVAVGSNDVTHGDNVSIDVNQSNLILAESQITNLVSDLALKAPIASPSFTGPVSSAGNIDIGAIGAGQRLLGQWDSAGTTSTLIQHHTTNSGTYTAAAPNGTGTTSSFDAYNNSNPSSGQFLSILMDGTSGYLECGKLGGSYKPLGVKVGGTVCMNWDASGGWTVTTATKTTPIDADSVLVSDSAASGNIVKTTWANVKATLKTYLDTLYPSGDSTAWVSYTPSVSASTGSYTSVSATGKYKQIGKTVFVKVVVSITTNGTAAGATLATLPVNAATAQNYFGGGRENGVTGVPLFCYNNLVSQMAISKYDATYVGGNGYILSVSMTYEAA